MHVIPVEELRELVIRVLESWRVNSVDARIVADVTLDADLDGRASHGVARVPAYVAKLERSGIDPDARIEVLHDNGFVFGIDAHHGFGQVGLQRASLMALERSRRTGVSCGLVRNMNNPGMLSSFGRLAAQAGQIAIIACNSAAVMPPYGGRTRFLGTNPICIVIPGPGGTLAASLDMSTTAGSKGAIRDADRHGRAIPDDWAVDKSGVPTSNPAAALVGLLRPIGGPKGSGLAMMVDMLAGVLSGSQAGPAVHGLHEAEPSAVGGMFIALLPDAFMRRTEFDARVAAYLDAVRRVPPAPEVERVLVPGDRATIARKERLRHGISIPKALWQQLTALAEGPSHAV